MSENRIRIAAKHDAQKLVEIYAPYVENTAITFEYAVPSTEEFADRIGHVLEKYPYLVAERDGEIVGYAYAGTFNSRAAYDWAVETTIYVREDQKRKGIGKALYTALEQILTEQNILNMNACIGYPDTEDEYLTKNSVQFHEHFGYRFAGEIHKCGYKFGRWYNIVWMEKHIGEYADNPPAIRTFDEVRDIIWEKYGIQ